MRYFLAAPLTFLLAACGGSAPPPETSATQPAAGGEVGHCQREKLAGEEDFAIMQNERLGGLSIGMPGKEVEKLLGTPAEKAPVTENQAAGGYYHLWVYPKLGLRVGLNSSERDGAAVVESVTADATSKAATRYGVHIGSTREQVLAAYGDCIPEPGPDSLVAGSIYGGVVFSFKNGVVESIFVGAAAE